MHQEQRVVVEQRNAAEESDSTVDGGSVKRGVLPPPDLAVPFASQSATLFTGTIRWNILFGAPYDEVLYKNVLRACHLEVDLLIMPMADLTEVAQGGATLSGGQRQRIGLARATYRAARQLRRQKQDRGTSEGPG